MIKVQNKNNILILIFYCTINLSISPKLYKFNINAIKLRDISKLGHVKDNKSLHYENTPMKYT